ncbi:hypothetical protein BH09VER1_BH09VER1_17120 [soil metagenome]
MKRLALLLALTATAHSQSFSPSLLKAELSRTTVSPGQEIFVTLTMTNQGDHGSTFFLRAGLEAQPKTGTPAFKLIGGGEPFPPTTLWHQNQVVTFGVVLSVPANAVPGEYDLITFLRPRDGGGTIPLNTGADKPQDIASLGRLTVAPTSEATPVSLDFAKSPAPVAPPENPAAPSSLKLSTPQTEVTLNSNLPIITQLGRTPAQLTSTPLYGQPDFLIFRQRDSQWLSTASSPDLTVSYQIEKNDARATYHATLQSGSDPVGTCDLFFLLAGQELRVGFENVRLLPGYILSRITWPRLIQSSQADSRLVNGRFAGRLLDAAKCQPATVVHEATWIDSFVGGAIYTPNTLATIGLDSPGDLITSSVAHDTSGPSVGFGVEFTHVIAALGADPKVWIAAAASSMVRLEILEKTPPSPPLTWIEGAKELRRAFTNIRPPAIYQDSVIYKILMDSRDYKDLPPEQPATSFPQAREILHQVSQLTDGIRQIAYLTGAQHEGQDTKYPDVFTTNPKLGTESDLISFIRSGPEYNAVVSFHSCATEAYKDSPMWSEDYVARDPSGGLFIYNHFAGGDCFWINQDWFSRHELPGLINRIFATYPITETYHIDVLSTRAANVDFNPDHPCSPNLGYAGRLRMVEEFNRHGIDLTSEGMISWFVGKIGHAWLLKTEPLTSVIGEEQVPFSPMLFHGHATYGLPSELNPLQGLLYGTTFSMDFMPLDRMKFLWPGNTLADCLYLQNFPFQMLRNREMQNYSRQGNLRRISYGHDTYVEIDVPDEALAAYHGYQKETPGHFRIVIDGRTVARDFTAFLPGPKADTYLAYSKFGGPVEYELPTAWAGAKTLKTTPLVHSDGPIKVTVKNGKVSLDLPAGIPVRISR